MPVSRRNFLHRSTVAFTAALAGTLPAMARPVSSAPVAVPLSTGAMGVVTWLRGWTSEIRLAGVAVLGRQAGAAVTRKWPFIVQIDDPSALGAVFSASRVEGSSELFTSGNVLSFSVDGEEFTVEALLPAEFQARLNTLGKRAGVTFATDGLVWDATRLTVSDPFSARASKSLKLVNSGADVVATFTTVLRAYSEAARAALPLGKPLEAFIARTLRGKVAKQTAADDIVALLAQAMPELTALLSTNNLRLLLATPLVSAALAGGLDVSSTSVSAAYAKLRTASLHGEAEATVWLAALLRPEIRAGVADVWNDPSQRFASKRFRAALTRAEAALTPQ